MKWSITMLILLVGGCEGVEYVSGVGYVPASRARQIQEDRHRDYLNEEAARNRRLEHELNQADSLEDFAEVMRKCYERDYALRHKLSVSRREWFVSKNPDLPRSDAVLNGHIQIGMTADQVRASWGEPEDINRHVSVYGVHAQWIYGRVYVYLENGIVTSWQD